MSRFRLLAAIIFLTLSLTLLIWGFWPVARSTRIQQIRPADLQLPTPISYLRAFRSVS